MGQDSKISWLYRNGVEGYSWGAWRGCAKVSPGCDHCWAESMEKRFRNPEDRAVWGAGGKRVLAAVSGWKKPVAWNAKAEREGTQPLVFCNPMGDIYERRDREQERWMRRTMCLISDTPHLDWLLLTKRPENIPGAFLYVLPNMWFGTSIESMDYAWRRDELVKVPSPVHWLSIEPMLGPVHDIDLTDIEWVIVGGESGPNYRDDPAWESWAAAMRDRCREKGVAFYFKQHPWKTPGHDPTLDGETIQEFPDV